MPADPDTEIGEAAVSFERYLRVDTFRFRHRLFSGGWSAERNYDVLRRGQAEAQIQKGLRHPNIVEIDDAGLTDEGQLYIVMERLRGRMWRDALIEYGRFEVEEEAGLKTAASTTACSGVSGDAR